MASSSYFNNIHDNAKCSLYGETSREWNKNKRFEEREYIGVEDITKYGSFFCILEKSCLARWQNSKKMALHSEVAASSSVIGYLMQFEGEH
jgi:hypothetical protein